MEKSNKNANLHALNKTNINNSKTNLVINYSNVTTKMKGEVILENGEVYISKDDIENSYLKN